MTLWQIDREKLEAVIDFIFLGSKITADSDCSNEIKSYAFSSSHVQMCELDHKEGWALKNWCFRIVVLEKTLESPFVSKEIKPVSHKCCVCLVTQSCPICDPKDCSLPGSSVHGDSPGKNIGVGCHALLQGIFVTQGLNPRLLHCRGSLHYLSHQGSPRILDWVAYPFSRGHFRPRNQTRVSCIAGWCFTSWATRES